MTTPLPPDPQAEWSFLCQRVLVVSPYPPREDGIARYAAQLVEALGDHRRLEVLGMPGGGGHRVAALQGGLRPLRIARYARGFDEVLIQYHPHYFARPGRARDRFTAALALGLIARLKRTTVVVHEPDEQRPSELGRRGRAQWAIEEILRRAFWRCPAGLVFHSEFERRRHTERFPPGRHRVDRVVSPGSFYRSHLPSETQADARRRLGLGADRVVLVMLGFLSATNPDKGYDRAVAAVKAAAERVELHVVGSPIRAGPDVEELLGWLRREAAESARIHLHERFVDDEEFDRWLRAADAVLAPYRTASSSGVVERAHLLGTRLIVSDAGGLAEQARPGDVVVRSDEDLMEAVRRVGAG